MRKRRPDRLRDTGPLYVPRQLNKYQKRQRILAVLQWVWVGVSMSLILVWDVWWIVFLVQSW